MEKKIKKSNNKEEASTLRKKIKRVQESRSSIKEKNREKAIVIKKSNDRKRELEESRDQWKAKCKQSEKEALELAEKYAQLAKLFDIKEEELRKILNEIDELKKKYPEKHR